MPKIPREFYSAYHLQGQAHGMVGNALACGELTRQPCEECGQEPAQAHHDSYFPENWLRVRWLCPRHHKEWHQNNEAEWPTIFEFHPSDRELVLDKRKMRKAGRPPRPWYRPHRETWYVTILGTRYNLGRNREDAFKKYRELLNLKYVAA